MLIRPSVFGAAFCIAFVVLGVGFLILSAAALLSTPRGPLETAVILILFGASGCGLIVLAVYALSERVLLSEKEITRRTIFGTRTVAVSELVSAYLRPRGRGFRALEIRTERETLSIVNLAFSNAQLDQIQKFVAEAGRKAQRPIQTTLPTHNLASKQFAAAVAVCALLVATVVAAVMYAPLGR
jgi:hypothetical protein